MLTISIITASLVYLTAGAVTSACAVHWHCEHKHADDTWNADKCDDIWPLMGVVWPVYWVSIGMYATCAGLLRGLGLVLSPPFDATLRLLRGRRSRKQLPEARVHREK